MDEILKVLIAVLGTLLFGIVSWVVYTTMQNKVRINTLDKNDEILQREMSGIVTQLKDTATELKELFSDFKTDLKRDINTMSNRLDLFLKTEIDELKKISKP